MSLLKNPFWLLGANEFSRRADIFELVELKSFILDEQDCNEARLMLITPSKRIESEIGWIYSLSAHNKSTSLQDSALDEIDDIQNKISLFLTTAQQWQEAHASSLFIPPAQQVFWLSNQITQASKDLQNQIDTNNYELKTLFQQGSSITISDLEWQKTDSLSCEVANQGWALYEHFSAVQDGLGALSQINLLCLMLECTCVYPFDLVPAFDSHDIVLKLIIALDKLDNSKVVNLINQARKVSGFTLITDESIVQEVLEEHRFKIAHLVSSRLDRLSHVEKSQYLNQLLFVVQQHSKSLAQSSFLLNELLKVYAMQNAEFFQQKLLLSGKRSFLKVGMVRYKLKVAYLHTFIDVAEDTRWFQICEHPFMALRLSWFLALNKRQIKAAFDEVCYVSLAWMSRLQPVIAWYQLHERDLRKIIELNTLFHLWREMLNELSQAKYAYPYVNEACQFFLNLCSCDKELHAEAKDCLRYVVKSSPVLAEGEKFNGELKVQLFVQAVNAYDPDNHIQIFTHALLLNKKRILLSDIEVMHFEKKDTIEVVTLKDDELNELATVYFSDHDNFLKFVHTLGELLFECKFRLRLQVLAFTQHWSNYIREGYKVICHTQQDVYETRSSKSNQGSLSKFLNLFSPSTSLSLTLFEKAPQGDKKVELDFSDVDNLPVFIYYVNTSMCKEREHQFTFSLSALKDDEAILQQILDETEHLSN